MLLRLRTTDKRSMVALTLSKLTAEESVVVAPSQFFIDRQIIPKINFWPTPDNSTDTLIFNRLVRIEDADSFTDNLDLPFRFYPCLAAGLAYYLSVKRAPDRISVLKALYEEEMERAMTEDRDRASFHVAPSLSYSRA